MRSVSIEVDLEQACNFQQTSVREYNKCIRAVLLTQGLALRRTSLVCVTLTLVFSFAPVKVKVVRIEFGQFPESININD